MVLFDPLGFLHEYLVGILSGKLLGTWTGYPIGTLPILLLIIPFEGRFGYLMYGF